MVIFHWNEMVPFQCLVEENKWSGTVPFRCLLVIDIEWR
jgi:hypothetical protein